MKKKSIELKNRQIFPIPKPGSAIQTQVDEDVTNENLPTIVQTDKEHHSSHHLLNDNSDVVNEEQRNYEAPESLTEAPGAVPHEIYLPGTTKNESEPKMRKEK